MSTPIHNSLSALLFTPANSSSSPATVQKLKPVQEDTNSSAATVKPTEVQQVYQLHYQGQTVPQIALALRIPVEAVNNFLRITEAESFGAPASAAANSSLNTPAAQATQAVQQSTSSSSDTVTLTEAQQVDQLYNEGDTVSQIATSLTLTVAAVNSYLGITKAS